MFNRNAEPIEWLKKAQTLFLNRISEIWSAASSQKVCILEESLIINPQSLVKLENKNKPKEERKDKGK